MRAKQGARVDATLAGPKPASHCGSRSDAEAFYSSFALRPFSPEWPLIPFGCQETEHGSGVRGKIFISYRRDDAPGDARGVHDALVRAFGKSNVFMDVDNLLAGQRFDKELEKALSQCDVLIAIIGPHWMELLSDRVQSTQGDYVRDEIAAALKRGIVVIPVRVGQEGSYRRACGISCCTRSTT